MTAPQARKPSANMTPKVLIGIPRMWITGCMRGVPGGAPRTLGHPKPGLRQSASMARGKAKFGKDNGLQARMLITMFLLGLVYVAFVVALIAAGAGAGAIVLFAVVMLVLQYYTADKFAMATMGVRE